MGVSMSKIFQQKEVDRLASFIEACGELEKEPFFGRDEKLSFRSAGQVSTFTFGDRFHFRSALISFRRLWMPREPSHWEKVVSVLKSPELPYGVGEFAKHHAQRIIAALKRDSHLMRFKMPTRR